LLLFNRGAKKNNDNKESLTPLLGHFVHNRIEYRIAYRILEHKKEIEVVLVKSRESFYQILKRVIKQRNP
jgi:hypothetical protein